jgi:hypothetical protein
VLLNDQGTALLARNIILLLILGSTVDISVAAEYALHVWYSAFVPIDYDLEVKSILSHFLETLQANKLGNITFSSALGRTSNISGMVLPSTMEWYCHCVQSKIDRATAVADLKRVRSVFV